MPLTGDVWRHSSLRIAYVAQHSLGHVEQHLTKTPVEYLQWRFAGAVDREALALTALQSNAVCARVDCNLIKGMCLPRQILSF
jgi:hypothetical protein